MPLMVVGFKAISMWLGCKIKLIYKFLMFRAIDTTNKKV